MSQDLYNPQIFEQQDIIQEKNPKTQAQDSEQEDEELDPDLNLKITNPIYFTFNIIYKQSQRIVNISIINTNKNKAEILEIIDNEQFSNLESLIIQNNIKDQYHQLNILLQPLPLKSEQEKIQSILENHSLPSQKLHDKHLNDYKYSEKVINKFTKLPLKQQNPKLLLLKNALCTLACTFRTIHQNLEKQRKFDLLQAHPEIHMKLDSNAQNSLSLFPQTQIQEQENIKGHNSLLQFLCHCQTIIGKRALKRQLIQPLQDKEEIEKRLDLVEKLVHHHEFRNYLSQNFFRFVPDTEKLFLKFHKIASEIKNHQATLDDAVKLYQLVKNIQNMITFIQINDFQDIFPEIYQNFQDLLESFANFTEMIEKCLNVNEAKNHKRFKINIRYSDKIRKLTKQIQQILRSQDLIKLEIQKNHRIRIKIIETEDQEGEETGFAFQTTEKDYKKASLNYNELRLGDEPLIFISKKSDREVVFTTKTFQDLSNEYHTYLMLYNEEYEIVTEKILKIVATFYPAMDEASSFISELDMLTSFALTVTKNNNIQMCKPQINENLTLKMTNSYHPCLEREGLVVNDIDINNNRNEIHIIQGPNMGGKSTFIRSVAINILLAHIGCYVCASEANIYITSSIFTRVGAQDLQLRKISTFMNEMIQTQSLLEVAGRNSFSIIDELGRGTSTTDGLGIAWGVCENMTKNDKGHCLFATHFQELAEMKNIHENIRVFTVANKSLFDKFKVKEEVNYESYGIDIMKMQNFPPQIIETAEKKLDFYKFIHDKKEQKKQQNVANQNNNNNDNNNQIDFRDIQSIQGIQDPVLQKDILQIVFDLLNHRKLNDENLHGKNEDYDQETLDIIKNQIQQFIKLNQNSNIKEQNEFYQS